MQPKRNMRTNIIVLMVLMLVFSNSSKAQDKNILLEEITGAWCGLCPGGFVYMDSLLAQYEQIIPVYLHVGDTLSCEESEILGDTYTGGGVPGFLIDRYLFDGYPYITFGLDYSLLNELIEQRMAMPVEAAIAITNVSLDENNLLNVVVETEFFENFSDADIRLNLYITEDSVSNIDPAYDQANFYNIVEDHPFYNQGPLIAGFEHRYVLRKMAGGAWGEINSLPQNINIGGQFSFTFQMALDENWDWEKIHLIALVQEYNDSTAFKRHILNATETALSGWINENPYPPIVNLLNDPDKQVAISGSGAVKKADFKATIFPNPVSESSILSISNPFTGVTKLSLRDLTGQLRTSSEMDLAGKNFILLSETLPVASLPMGIYFLEVECGGQKKTLKLRR